jgi:UDP-N-acetylmuramoylalanine--D-glutamate ligase
VKDLASKKVLVVGLARSGRAAVELLLGSGSSVVATDSKSARELGLPSSEWIERGVELVLGGEQVSVPSGIDLLVVSPGVPSDVPLLADARARRIPVIGELELAYRVSEGTWLAVTGTNGKTTTTALLGELVKTTGRDVVVAGNIGVALSGEVARVPEGGFIVAEVSSFQLDTIAAFRPHVAALLNITEDHLDRYASMDDYVESKRRVFLNQTPEDYAVVNVDDPVVERISRDIAATVIPVSATREVARGVFVRGGTIVSRVGGEEAEIVAARDLRIPGPHNLANALAAVGAACAVGVTPEDAARTLAAFSPIEHRLEVVAEIAGVLYVNDSKATNVDSVRYALQSYDSPIVLIAGGKDKGSDFSVLAGLVRKHVKAAILIGQAAAKMEAALAGATTIERASSLHEAVLLASGIAEEGDVVLLSPACASFDMFQDFEDRGRKFKGEVASLAARRSGARGGGSA